MSSPALRAGWQGLGVLRVRPALYIALVLLALAGAFVVKLRTFGIFACPADYAGKAYLSDCSVSGYGDYDHGAFWYGLEPQAAEAVRRALVLLLGNSRAQFAFSAPATRRWFAERSLPFYSLGFSHYESVTFVTPVVARVQPQPRAYVINADRFFAQWLSPTSEEIVKGGGDTPSRYREKKFWQGPHRWLCGSIPALCGQQLAIYRDGNGLWSTIGTLPDRPGGVADGPPGDQQQWPRYIELAREFVGRLKVDRQCVVLTIVPYADTKRAEAEAIAQALGVPFIAPQIADLRTFDNSHLDVKSAARWSAAFFEAAGPVLERCAGAGGAAAGG